MTKRSGSTKLILVAILLVVMAAVWFLVFATRTVTGTRLVYTFSETQLTAAEIVSATERRVRCFYDSRFDVSLAEDGKQLRIDLSTQDPEWIKSIDQVLHHEGQLRFLVMARSSGDPVVAAAEAQAEEADFSRDVKNEAGESVGRWVYIDSVTNDVTGQRKLRVDPISMQARNSTTGQLIDWNAESVSATGGNDVEQWMADKNVPVLDALAVVDPNANLDGDAVEFASLTFDPHGQPAIALEFTAAGGAMLADLTTRNSPIGQNHRQLGIIIDDRLITAPKILATIGRQAQITGDFSQSEAQTLVMLLKSGRLPFELSDKPIKQESIEMSVPVFTWPLQP